MRPVAPAAQAVHAAPSHVVGAHSPRVPRSSCKEERGTVVWMLEEGVVRLLRRGLGPLEVGGQLLGGLQADDEAAARHRVNLAI